MLEKWRSTWRDGFAPLMPTPGLEALAEALRTDDPKLQQGLTTTPPPVHSVQDWPVEGADAIGFIGWKGGDLETVGEVEEFFARACFECDRKLGEPAACRFWLNWWDDSPRDRLFREVLPEVNRELCRRYVGELSEMLSLDIEDATAVGIVADWLDEHDLPEMAALWRAHMQELLEAVK